MLIAGDTLPNFDLAGTDKNGPIRLRKSDLTGKRVVLYFYPKDDTPGCTREAVSFQALEKAFAAANVVVIGVSRDTNERHAKFQAKYGLRFALLADPEKTLHLAMGSWGEKVMYGKRVEGTIRSTFVINEKGKIEKVYPKVNVDGHAEEVLSYVRGDEAQRVAGRSQPKATASAKHKAATKNGTKAGTRALAAKPKSGANAVPPKGAQATTTEKAETRSRTKKAVANAAKTSSKSDKIKRSPSVKANRAKPPR
jgi:thioredoxin-dependent peroxiredoxin